MKTKAQTIPISLNRLMFTAAELKGIPKHERAFLVSSEIAFNDVNFFLSLCLQTLNSHSDDEISCQYSLARYSICLRNLSARIFEFYKLLEAYQQTLRRKKLPSNPAVDITVAELTTAMREHRFFDLMNWHRNNVTSHYVIDRIPKLIDNFPHDHEFVDFEHQIEGNTLSVFAEEIGFFGEMNSRHFSFEDVNAFLDWLNDLAARCKRFRAQFILNLLHTRFPNKAAVPVTANARPDLIRDVRKSSFPLFFIGTDGESPQEGESEF